MITAQKARALMWRDEDDVLMRNIEADIITAAKKGNGSTSWYFKDVNTARRFANRFFDLGYKATLGWPERGSDEIQLTITW